ncbi:putative lipid II flippase FtsW [Tuberibacillus sp. Marseille-P3662]|uniref:putative lipid II flippase FtsW n=1 Tax=Tuberibacillus sp. Marseille-P3662 TaxID=1965358 RepID=UPI000A1CDC81|nr:putative lipid II flippase FtsW [Tuberibacillus sp. Marseille-P3662]
MLKKMFRNYDYTLVVTVLLLIGFGLVMVYSASTIISQIDHDTITYIFKRQMMWAVIAISAGFVAMLFPYKAYQKLIKWIVPITLLLLGLVFIIGETNNNATSWLSLGPINIQPAEMAKLTLILYLASVFANKQRHISQFKTSVLPPLIVVILFFFLIAAQPDLGSAMIVAGIASCVIICSGIRVKHLVSLLSLALVAIAVLFTMLLSPEQKNRIEAVGQPFTFAQDEGLQLVNSYIAIASGGWSGKGLGNSIEKTGFLPFPHTDFIMAIVAEELGILGVAFVLLLLAYIVVRGFLIGIKAQDVFGSLLAIGIASFIGIQAGINLCVIVGLMPVTGVPLPFISYGGSSLVMTMISVGVLINISSFVKMREKKRLQEVA